MVSESNWAGNYTFRASRIHRPSRLEEARKLVANAPRIRGIGARHSFHDIADSAEIISLEIIEPGIEIDPDAMTATASASLPYGDFAAAVHGAGYALHNMGSLPHISIGGATATATHGSGSTNGNLSSAVSALEFITSEGDTLRVTRSEADFSGMVVHLGALGLVTRVTFDIQPTFEVSQEVLDDLPWEPLLECFTEIFSSAYSVSVFTTFGHDRAGSLWRKHRHSEGGLRSEETWGATPANEARHPVRGFASDPCTTQLMQAGPWCDRLPHFRIGAVPSAGQEIQVEYMIDIDHASEAVRALRAFEPRLRDVLIVSELRTIAADDLWLSTAYGRDSLAIHFTCHRDQAKIDALLPDLESLLEPFSPRPHWGKVFSANAETLASRYPKYGDFRQLRQQLDPRGAFINPFMERVGLA